MIKQAWVCLTLSFLLVWSPVALAQDPRDICFSRNEIAAMRKKTAERKKIISNLKTDLETCKKKRDNDLTREILKRKSLEQELQKARSPLPWILVGVAVAAGIIGMIIVGVVK